MIFSVVYMIFSVVYMLFSVVYMLLHIKYILVHIWNTYGNYISLVHSRFNKVVANHAMEKTKELSQRMRRLIVDEHSHGMGYRKISSKYNIHVSTIRAIIQRWERYDVVTNLPRKGRPRKLDERAERLQITRKVMQKPFTT